MLRHQIGVSSLKASLTGDAITAANVI